MVKILVTHNNDLLVNFYNVDAVEELKAFADVRVNGTDTPLEGDALIEAARDVDIIVSDRLAPGTPQVFESLPNLAVYMRCAVDIRNIDVEAASKAGTLVVRCSSGYNEAVAEVAIGLVLTLARRIHIGDRLYKEGQAVQPMILGRQLHGASIGIIGFGNIGKRIGDLAIAFGMKVHAFDPYMQDRQRLRDADYVRRRAGLRLRGLRRLRHARDRADDEPRRVCEDAPRRLLREHLARHPRG